MFQLPNKAMTLSLSDSLISVVKQIPNLLPNLKLAQALFSSQISPPNFTMQKEDSLSHQNTGTYMEY
jgi:hypothetical protein